ncbi:hypothetical protein FOPG_20166, partial [Fusarium oxysporum f. sp. conglutinans race 2 54008]
LAEAQHAVERQAFKFNNDATTRPVLQHKGNQSTSLESGYNTS